MTIIKFDESCAGWCKINFLTYQFLGRQCEYLKELLKARGYLYLNSIYEILGVKWNPEWKNICFLNEFDVTLDVKPDGDNCFVIRIY